MNKMAKDNTIIQLASFAISLGLTILLIISVYNPAIIFKILLSIIGVGLFILLNLFVYLFIQSLYKLNKNK